MHRAKLRRKREERKTTKTTKTTELFNYSHGMIKVRRLCEMKYLLLREKQLIFDRYEIAVDD